MPATLSKRLGDQLSPEALLHLLGIDPQETVSVGDTVKANCPLCRNGAFKTLFLNLQRRTFACKFTQCAAHGGGDWLQLVALVRQLTEVEALHLLVRELDITLPPEDAAHLGDSLENQGLDALGVGELAAARRLLEEAEASRLAVTPEGSALSPEVLAKLAHCCWELGDHDAARLRYRQVFEHQLATGEVHNAILMLADLINVDHEWAPELHLILGKTLREMGDVDQALAHLLSATDGLRRLGQGELAEQAVAAAAELGPENEIVQRALVESALFKGDWPTALANLDGFLRACEGETDRAAALMVLARLDEAGQLDLGRKLQRASLCLQAGDQDQARAILEAIEADELHEETLIDFLLEKGNPSPEWTAILLRLLLRAERWEEAREALISLLSAGESRITHHAPLLDQAFAALGTAYPKDLSLRARQLDWSGKRAPREAVLSAAQRLLRDCAEAAATSEETRDCAETAWRWIRELAPADLAQRAEALPLLWRVTQSKELLLAWRMLVREARESLDYEIALTSAHALLDQIGFDLGAALEVLNAAEALQRLPIEHDFALKTAAALREAGDPQGAESVLRSQLTALGPEEREKRIEVLAHLAEIVEQRGQPDEAASLSAQEASLLLELLRAQEAVTIVRHWLDEAGGAQLGVADKQVIESLRRLLAQALEAASEAKEAGRLWLILLREAGTAQEADDALAQARRLLGEKMAVLEAAFDHILLLTAPPAPAHSSAHG